MKRFLDVLLVFFITLFIFNTFLLPDKNDTLKDALNIVFEESDYTIPASVKVLVQNYTSSGITIDTCKDVNILKSGEKIEFSSEICKEVPVAPGEVFTIDYSTEYKKFDKIGNYTLELEIDDKKFIDQFELENKGVISKVFLWLIYAPIYNLLVFLIELFSGVFGWAVIGLTLILKIFLFYPQQKALVSQRKIQDLQPKIKKIQEEYKGQQQIIGQKLLELYNKEKVNPLGSCGFLLIQMPILLVVYNVISKIQNPVNNYYIYSHFNDFSFTSINFNFYGLDLLASKGMQGIILALFVAGIQFLQLKVSLPKKVKDNEKGLVLEKKENKIEYSAMPNPDVLNKFMLYGMPVMVGIFTYSWFAAIGLYWGISTLLTLFQNLITNKISKK